MDNGHRLSHAFVGQGFHLSVNSSVVTSRTFIRCRLSATSTAPIDCQAREDSTDQPYPKRRQTCWHNHSSATLTWAGCGAPPPTQTALFLRKLTC